MIGKLRDALEYQGAVKYLAGRRLELYCYVMVYPRVSYDFDLRVKLGAGQAFLEVGLDLFVVGGSIRWNPKGFEGLGSLARSGERRAR